MLDANFKENSSSLEDLFRSYVANKKTPLIWIGAGCSKWSGYPLWFETADSFNRVYLRMVPEYDKAVAHNFLDSKQYLDYFSYCKELNLKIVQQNPIR